MRYAATRAWIREHAKSEMWQKSPFTAVRLVATWQGREGTPSAQEYIGLGFAKCNPSDEWDAGKGDTIARGRAEVDMARQIEHENPFLPMARSINRVLSVFQDFGKQMGSAFAQAKQEGTARQEQAPSDALAAPCESEGQDG